jgi:hypothetical protein
MDNVIDLSTVEKTCDGYLHTTKYQYDAAPTLDSIHKMRLANAIRHKGWSDNRLMRFRARIPAMAVWEAEHVLGYNLNDKRDFQAYLVLHPEYIVAPDTGADGKIIVKGG